MLNLIDKVRGWAYERNLIFGSTPEKQLQKTAGELIELAIEVGREEAIRDFSGPVGSAQRVKTASELGDVLVTLIIVAEQLGLEMEDCLSVAYEKIKDRKGVMRGGVFVKEADL